MREKTISMAVNSGVNGGKEIRLILFLLQKFIYEKVNCLKLTQFYFF